jgi:hypothetical protein
MPFRKKSFKKLAIIKMALAVLLPLLGPELCYSEQKNNDSDFYYAHGKAALMPVKNQMPLYVFYLNMLPDTSHCIRQGKFSTDLHYQVSNTVLDKVTTGTDEYIIQIDNEVYRVSNWLKYGITDNLEASIEISYIGLSKGYLDGFIENCEETLGLTTPGARENSAHNSYKYEIRYKGEYLVRKNSPASGIGDTSIYLKYNFLQEEPAKWYLPGMSIRCALKFPTADKDDLLGSGEYDFGSGLLLDKHLTEKLALFGNTNIIFIKKPSFFKKWSMENYIFSWMAALEYRFTEKFSATVQHIGNTTPYPSSGTDPLDNLACDVGLGLNYRFNKKLTGTISCFENTNTDSSPDLSFQTGIKYDF